VTPRCSYNIYIYTNIYIYIFSYYSYIIYVWSVTDAKSRDVQVSALLLASKATPGGGGGGCVRLLLEHGADVLDSDRYLVTGMYKCALLLYKCVLLLDSDRYFVAGMYLIECVLL
jgi:hypothetical protein